MTNELTAQQNGLVTNQAQLQIFTQTTPKEAIRTRQGRGGRVLLYTDGAYVIRTLNEAFGHNWDLEADNEEIFWFNEKPFEAKCRVKLTVRIGDTSITKMQYGCQPIEMLSNGTAPVSIGDALKGAATDGLKKCASLLGIALDLYDSDSQINTANPQQVQKEIAQAKAQATKAPVTIEQHTTTHMPNGQVIVANKTIDAATGEVIPNSPSEPLQASTLSFDSPQGVIDAAHAAIGQVYYKAPAHAYNALRQELGSKWTWPKPGNKEGWNEAYEFLVYHAKNEAALEAGIAPLVQTQDDKG